MIQERNLSDESYTFCMRYCRRRIEKQKNLRGVRFYTAYNQSGLCGKVDALVQEWRDNTWHYMSRAEQDEILLKWRDKKCTLLIDKDFWSELFDINGG